MVRFYMHQPCRPKKAMITARLDCTIWLSAFGRADVRPLPPCQRKLCQRKLVGVGSVPIFRVPIFCFSFGPLRSEHSEHSEWGSVPIFCAFFRRSGAPSPFFAFFAHFSVGVGLRPHFSFSRSPFFASLFFGVGLRPYFSVPIFFVFQDGSTDRYPERAFIQWGM
jgi:hypothetical protein